MSEVGRQPWIVYEQMKVEDAATANTGVWVTFIGVVLLYLGLGVTTVLVLRGMSRRFRRQDEAGDPFDEADVAVRAQPSRSTRSRRPAPMSTAAAVVLVRRDHHVRRLRRRRLRRRLLGPRRGRDQAGRAAPRGHRPLDRPGLGGQPRLADLRVRGAVDLLPAGLRLDHPRPSSSRSPSPPSASCCAGAGFAFRKAVFRTRDRRNFGAAFAISSVLVPYCLGAVVGGIASGRVPAGGEAGDPWSSWVNPTSILGGRARRVPVRLPRRVLPRRATPAGSPTTRWWSTSGGGPRQPPSPPASWRVVGIFVLSDDADVPLRRAHLAGPAAGHRVGALRRRRAAAAAAPRDHRGAAPRRRRRGRRRSSSPGAWRSGTTCSPSR